MDTALLALATVFAILWSTGMAWAWKQTGNSSGDDDGPRGLWRLLLVVFFPLCWVLSLGMVQ